MLHCIHESFSSVLVKFQFFCINKAVSPIFEMLKKNCPWQFHWIFTAINLFVFKILSMYRTQVNSTICIQSLLPIFDSLAQLVHLQSLYAKILLVVIYLADLNQYLFSLFVKITSRLLFKCKKNYGEKNLFYLHMNFCFNFQISLSVIHAQVTVVIQDYPNILPAPREHAF